MKIGVFLLISSFTLLGTAQEQLNSYKYIEVSNQYDFQKEPDQYRLNDLIIFELEKKGFVAFKNERISPEDKNKEICNTLILKVEKSGTTSRKLIFHFDNCAGERVYSTKEGTGRQKDNKAAYYSAVRDAMSSLNGFNHKYVPIATQLQGNENALDGSAPQFKTAVNDQDKNTNLAKKIDTPSKKTLSQTTEINKTIIKKKPIIKSAIATQIKLDYVASQNKTTGVVITANNSVILYKDDMVVGKGLKTSAGVYLIQSSVVNGVGFSAGTLFVIEYEKNGALQRMEFVKAN